MKKRNHKDISLVDSKNGDTKSNKRANFGLGKEDNKRKFTCQSKHTQIAN